MRFPRLVSAAAVALVCACGEPATEAAAPAEKAAAPVVASADAKASDAPGAAARPAGDTCRSWAELDPATLPPLPETPYTATFDRVWRTVLEKHFDPTLACKDWPSLRAEYGAKLTTVADAPAAYKVMNDLLETLGQSHFKVVPPLGGAEPDDTSGGPARVPIHVRMIGEQLVVVDPKVGGVASGVPAGAVLVKIGDKTAEALIARARSEAMRPGEVAYHAAFEAGRALWCQPGQKRRLTYLDPGAKDAEVTKEVACVTPPGERVSLGNLRDLPTTVEHRMLTSEAGGKKIGYIAFNYWMLPMVERVKAAMTDLRGQGMEALVLDLRGNPGGVGAMSIPVARLLLQESGSLGKLQFREFTQEFNVAGDPQAFAGPVIVLVDEGTASTSEIFAAGLRDLGRVRVAGARASAGAALPSLLERLENGALLQYVVGDYHSAKGTVAEGDGVHPDITAVETRADFVAGRDPVLAAAVAAFDSKSP
ncbi:carboxyl-terminal processing protease [Nannocystis exedens]|uniref:Carboxyl-terminal processing protease n=1 Tax=Nannocystis exedens TaxID=54 RepID=A0A1I1WZ70_9BACT|nr:S41 family peptidase [Nannocystis exedens]PCC70902.1 peptidase [Nannocystis exedens]SFE00484.1 carboxyl-terminal processing protease [Nannocystis exedens]